MEAPLRSANTSARGSRCTPLRGEAPSARAHSAVDARRRLSVNAHATPAVAPRGAVEALVVGAPLAQPPPRRLKRHRVLSCRRRRAAAYSAGVVEL